MREKTIRLVNSSFVIRNSSLSEALHSSDNFLFKRVKGIKTDKKQEIFQIFSKIFKTCKMACRSDLESFGNLKEKKFKKKRKKFQKSVDKTKIVCYYN